MKSSTRSLARFAAVALVVCLPLWLLGARANLGGLLGGVNLPLSALTFMAPALVAVVVSVREGDLPRLLARVRDFSGAYRWWWLGVAACALAWVVGSPPGWTLPSVGLVISASGLYLVGALGEELGWSAYGLEHARRLPGGAWAAAAVMSAIWLVFHAVPYLQTGNRPWWIAGMLVQIVGSRFLLVGTSLLGRNFLWPAVLIHAFANVVWTLSPYAGARFNPWLANAVLIPAGLVLVWLAARRDPGTRRGRQAGAASGCTDRW